MALRLLNAPVQWLTSAALSTASHVLCTALLHTNHKAGLTPAALSMPALPRLRNIASWVNMGIRPLLQALSSNVRSSRSARGGSTACSSHMKLCTAGLATGLNAVQFALWLRA